MGRNDALLTTGEAMPFRLLENYITYARRSTSPSELFEHSRAAAGELGFSRLAIVHALAFFCPEGRYCRLDNFADFGEIFVAERFYRDDPALLASRRTNRPFVWSEMKHILGGYTARQALILRDAARHGLRNGLTVPVAVSGEPAGCCSFATPSGRLPDSERCWIAALLADQAFAEARRLHGYPRRQIAPPDLSPRRIECFRYAAMGLSDRAIAEHMGVAPTTVQTHMKALRAHFGTSSRTQLAGLAVACGLLGIDEVVPKT